METASDTPHHSRGTDLGFGRRLLSGGAACLVAIGFAGTFSIATAYAHSGSVVAAETCSTWSASVTLAHNVTSDRFVDVLTTIPGTTGISGGHFDSSYGLIWSGGGQAPSTGTVTLNIYYNKNGAPGPREFTATASIVPAHGCVATPSIATAASPGGPVGTVIHDTATVSGGNSPTGTVTFRLFANTADCTAGSAALLTSTDGLTVSAPILATSKDLVTTGVGTFQWLATYSGDQANHSVSSVCGSEPVSVSRATPAITTDASAGGPLGTAIHDSATLTGGNSPTGTVTFTLFAGTASCTDGNALYTSPAEPLSTTAPHTATSGTYIPAGLGTFQWRATYSGDANNQGTSSACGDEPDAIGQAAPTITTTASAGGVAPVSVHDTATLAGGVNPSGTVVFALYPDTASCSAGTSALYTSPAEALAAGVATSGSFSLASAGTDQWKATYSGDTNNAAVSSRCGDEPVTSTDPGSVQGITTGPPSGGVQAIATPSTGASGIVADISLGALLILGGLGTVLAGAIQPRRRNTV
jgi:hypothetical protein